MSNSLFKQFFLALTSVKGALIAAPLIVGVGVLLSFYNSSTNQLKPATNSADGTEEILPVKYAQAAGGETFSAEQETEIGKIVRSYLLKNPEVLQEVGEELARRQLEKQKKQQLATLKNEKNEIFNAPLDYSLGDDDADVTIVEYFDYNCGWCKRALNEVTKLSQADSKVRVVMKEFPIFGEHSEFAARAAMAAKAQGKYWDYHVALMQQQRITKDNALKIAESVGIDVEKLKTEMKDPKYDAAIKQTQRIATALGIEGTPAFIVDDNINPGFRGRYAGAGDMRGPL
ncbi:MAG: DsbA family protein [Pseudomonadota bacterium]